MEQWGKDGKTSQGWRRMEMSAAQSKQGHWSETHFLLDGPDSRNVVVNTTCRQEDVGEVSDVQAHGGDIWIEEAEMVVITELDERLCL